MSDFNKLHIMGNLVRDPEQRYTTTGISVVSFTIASNRVSGSGNDRKDKTCFLNCVGFGKAGEAIAKFCVKGDRILIDGSLDQDYWEDKATGQKRTAHKCVVSTVNFIKTKNRPDDHTSPGSGPVASAPGKHSRPASDAQSNEAGHQADAEDDVPF